MSQFQRVLFSLKSISTCQFLIGKTPLHQSHLAAACFFIGPQKPASQVPAERGQREGDQPGLRLFGGSRTRFYLTLFVPLVTTAQFQL